MPRCMKCHHQEFMIFNGLCGDCSELISKKLELISTKEKVITLEQEVKILTDKVNNRMNT